MKPWEAMVMMTKGGLFFDPEVVLYFTRLLIASRLSEALWKFQVLAITETEDEWHIATSDEHPADDGKRFFMTLTKQNGQITEFGITGQAPPPSPLITDPAIVVKLAEVLILAHWDRELLARQQPFVVSETADEWRLHGTRKTGGPQTDPRLLFMRLQKSDGQFIDFLLSSSFNPTPEEIAHLDHLYGRTPPAP